jgi:predicted ATPase
MLKTLNIENFKCFLNQDINFGKITVLAGANGVGKSTVVQSLLLLRRTFEELTKKQEILINDKQHSFLELNNTKEILNSFAKTETISFIATDEHNKYYEIVFSLLNNLILQRNPFPANNIDAENEADKLPFDKDFPFYYLNAERLGPRNILEVKESDFLSVGFQGELTGYAIHKAENEIKISENKRFEQTTEAILSKQMEFWMQYLIPEVEIQVKHYDEINQVRIGIRKQGSETGFLHPNNIGFGISYVLPIVVAGLLAEKDSMLIVENPEAHLHPSGQSRIGQFLAKMAGAGVQVVVETHSEHVVNGIRLASLKEWISYQDVIINFFSQEKKGEVKVDKIELNQLSDLTKWPIGFFDQAQKDVLEIMQLKKSKK